MAVSAAPWAISGVDCVFERTQVDEPYVLTAGQCGFVDDPAGDVREPVLVELDSTLPGLFPVGDEQILGAEQESAAEGGALLSSFFHVMSELHYLCFPGGR